MTMRVVFWSSSALVGYAYVGYPLVLWLFARPRPILKQPATPTVSIVMAARNEAASLPAKLENLRSLDYPPPLTQVIVVSDGSTDGTAAILQQAGGVMPLLLAEAGGKARALNAAVLHATGEILIFLDARQSLDADAISELVCCFADPSVGAVSGELLLESSSGSGADALGLYWRIEKAVRRLESASGSVVGVTGAIHAMRRELYTELPPGTILDDVFLPMHAVREGWRVIFQPSAIARDRLFSEPGKEFGRKVRTLTGNYQLVRLAPWLLSPRNPLLFRFISHKLARLGVPLFLVGMLVGSAWGGPGLLRACFWLQVLLYLAAGLGVALPAAKKLKPVAIASTFVMLNAAAVCAFYNFVRGRSQVWK